MSNFAHQDVTDSAMRPQDVALLAEFNANARRTLDTDHVTQQSQPAVQQTAPSGVSVASTVANTGVSPMAALPDIDAPWDVDPPNPLATISELTIDQINDLLRLPPNHLDGVPLDQLPPRHMFESLALGPFGIGVEPQDNVLRGPDVSQICGDLLPMWFPDAQQLDTSSSCDLRDHEPAPSSGDTTEPEGIWEETLGTEPARETATSNTDGVMPDLEDFDLSWDFYPSIDQEFFPDMSQGRDMYF